MFHWLSSTRLIATVAAVMVSTGAAAGSQRPVNAGEDETAPASLDAVQRKLEGTWELASLSVRPAGGAALVPVAAQGTLIYDKDGNLTIEARTSDSYAPEAAQSGGVLEFQGKAAIDVAKGELKLTESTDSTDPKAASSPERRRRYAFEGDQLRLSSVDEAGKLTVTSTWRRR